LGETWKIKAKRAMDEETTKERKRKPSLNKHSDSEGRMKKKKKKLEDSHPSKPSEPIEPFSCNDEKPKRRKRDATSEDGSEKKKKPKKDSKSAHEPEELEIDISAPTPPSKKTLRMQKKGKPIPSVPSASKPTPPSSPPADPIYPDRKKLATEIPRAEFSVWIGNLSYKSDVKALRGWLVRGDKRVTDKDITRMNLPLTADGLSKGYKYLLWLRTNSEICIC
jgi:hypothetical protein